MTTSFLLLSIVIVLSVFPASEPQVIHFQDSMIEPTQIWPMYRHTITHTGLAPDDCTIDQGLTLNWRTKRLNKREYTASKSSPAVDQEKIYIGLDTGHLIAIDRMTGETIWWFKTRPSRNGIHGSPALDPESDIVYIGAYDGWLYAVNKNFGTLVWETKLGDYIGSSPLLFNGTVFIGVEMKAPAGYLVGMNAGNGVEVFWSEMFQSHPHSTPTVDPETGSILIGSNDSFFYCYWIGNKSERWRFKTGGDIKSTAAVAEGISYITSFDSKLYAVDITTGQVKWEYDSDQPSMSSPTLDVSGRRVYFGTHGGTIYAIDMDTGVFLWSFETEGRVMSSPTLVESTKTIVIGSDDRFVFLLDSETGEEKQRIELISGLSGVPVTVGNQLYVFDNLGYLYAYSN